MDSSTTCAKNIYAYVGNNPLSDVDPLGLDDAQCMYDPASCGMANNRQVLVPLPQPVLDFSTAVADAASFGLGPLARSALGVDGGVNRCSTAYAAGEWASLGLGAGRMAYAGITKAGAMAAAGGVGAVAFRNGLKRVMRRPLAGLAFRIKNYDALMAQYGSDEAIQAAAGRSNKMINAVGADLTIGGTVGAGSCGCQ